MRSLHARLQADRRRLNVPWDVLERDYLLSWILAGITRVDVLRDTLVFKGGTALKKCYFGDYRFSEDLDFSAVGGAPTGATLELAMGEACVEARRLLDEYVSVEIRCERYVEREPHPAGQEAFGIRARFPWHREPMTRVMVEVTMDEVVLYPVQTRAILHDYGELLEARVQVYGLEEILAEKLRAILQHAAKLRERGWSRSRARDYYDIWRILGAYRNSLDCSGFTDLLQKKCVGRNVVFSGADDFFEEVTLSYVERTWRQWLGPLVPDLPAFDTVVGELRPAIRALFSG